VNTKRLVTIFVCALAFAACSKQTPPTETVASAEAPMTDEALDQASIPVKEDFEEQASREVTEENLDDQLAALEKQIDEDK
jgi:outer membrane PBP1 activator LpoA protein